MNAKSFCFIQEQLVGQTTRERQVEQARARSHAATVASKKTWKWRREAEPTLFEGPKILKYRLPKTSIQKFGTGTRDGGPGEEQRHVLDEPVAPLADSIHQSEVRLSDYSCSPGLRIDPFYSTPYSRHKSTAKIFDFRRFRFQVDGAIAGQRLTWATSRHAGNSPEIRHHVRGIQRYQVFPIYLQFSGTHPYVLPRQRW
jgi:hypothetical protein